MATTNDGRSETSTVATGSSPKEVKPETSAVTVPTAPPSHPVQQAKPGQPVAASPTPSPEHPPWLPWQKGVLTLAIIVGIVIGGYFLYPVVVTAMNTVSTDDAYVNGHVTFLAPRVGGQVTKVFVDDNWRVKRGDLLVQLDKEPYQVQVDIKKSALVAAERDLTASQAQARGLAAQARSNRYKLEHAIEDVNNQIANLGANVAALDGKKANLALSVANVKRGEETFPSGGISKEELDIRRQTVKANEAAVEQALKTVYASRAGLGLPIEPPEGQDLAQVPPDLDQNFSSVRQALATTLESAAQLGYFPTSWDSTPKQAVADFYKQDAKGNLDHIYNHLIKEAPTVKQAEAKVLQAQNDLAQAELNLRYCDIVSDIDGQVTRRNVNPGNYVQMGQSLMAVRSLTEIWIDANFKETQLADLRIGQRVRCEIDMYGTRKEYEGRITGFTMGTGQTLALLPPQNATGNFVKIVQRLPVRIELTDYDPDKDPLFVGLSVAPYVYYKEAPAGPNAGKVLRPNSPLLQAPVDPKP